MARKHKKSATSNAWRPNFRNADALPDIKVVRTDFLLNLVTVSIAVILAGIVGVREYRMMSQSREFERLQSNIRASAPEDQQNVRQSNDFNRLGQVASQVASFLNVPVEADVLLYHVASVQPDEVVLESLNFTSSSTRSGRREVITYLLVLNGTVTDSPVRSATEIITDYRNAFQGLEVFEDYFEGSDLSGFTRNELLGNFAFTIRVTLSLEPKPKK